MFQYKGSFHLTQEEDHNTARVCWGGNIFPIENCPDVRSMPTPLPYTRVHNPAVVGFSIQGSIQGVPPRSKPGRFPWLTSPQYTFHSWPEFTLSFPKSEEETKCDDDSNNKESTSNGNFHQTWHAKDSHHELFVTERGRKTYQRTVIGLGRNEKGGAFIESGMIENHCMDPDDLDEAPAQFLTLVLVRRYLTDSDERTTFTHSDNAALLRWHVQMNFPPLVDNGFLTNRILEYCETDPVWRKPFNQPIQSFIMNSTIPWGQCQYDQGGRLIAFAAHPDFLSNQTPPPICMPTYSQDSSFSLDLSGLHPDAANVLWEDQCWGCGGHCALQDKIKFGARICTPYEYDWPFWFGEFCSENCVRRAVPEIARVSILWRKQNRNEWIDGEPITFSIDERYFWSCLDDDAGKRMRDAGWEDESEYSDEESGLYLVLKPEERSDPDEEESELEEEG